MLRLGEGVLIITISVREYIAYFYGSLLLVIRVHLGSGLKLYDLV
jgi:hypothetical protein